MVLLADCWTHFPFKEQYDLDEKVHPKSEEPRTGSIELLGNEDTDVGDECNHSYIGFKRKITDK